MSRSHGPTRSRHLVAGILAVILAVALLGVGAAVGLTSGATKAFHAVASQQVPVPVLTVTGPSGPQTALPWNAPLTLAVTDGSFRQVSAVDPDGQVLPGDTVDPSTWRSSAPSLLPAATYHVSATVADKAGAAHSLHLTLQTTPADRLVHARLTPGDGDVVGVGMPVIVDLDHSVTTAADRAAVVARLTVTTSPSVAGSWRWMTDRELHYRASSYWAAQTAITVRADFHRLELADGTWGSGVRTSAYRVGDSMVSTVDVTAHVMSVLRNGVLARVAKVSTGRDKYPTKGGVHIVLEKSRVQIMDSATVGIPRTSPDGYYEKVPFSVRISYGGAFVHSADWSVQDQGVRNVSHGCVNMSPSDAEWFFGLAKRGDIVNVIHSSTPPVLSDPGMSDWNIPFSQWAD